MPICNPAIQSSLLNPQTSAGLFELAMPSHLGIAHAPEPVQPLQPTYVPESVNARVRTPLPLFVPLMAAIGKARQRGYSVDEHQAALLEFIRKSRTADPVVFGRSVSEDDEGDRKADPRALFTILDNLTSNIGKYTRNIVYRAFLQFFRQGIRSEELPDRLGDRQGRLNRSFITGHTGFCRRSRKPEPSTPRDRVARSSLVTSPVPD